MTDVIAVRGLECFAHHGVLEHERREGQTFLLDLELGVDTRAAAGTDDLAETVDYGGLVASVKAAVERDPVDLIETLAERISRICLADHRVEWTRVTVHKPGAPVEAKVADITLTITRAREDGS